MPAASRRCLARALLLGLVLWCWAPEAEGKVLTIEATIQEQNQWCWAAVTRSVLAYYGHDISQCSIAEYTRSVATWHDFGPTNCCTDPTKGCNYWNYIFGPAGSIKDLLQKLGNLPGTNHTGALTKAQIQAEIDTNSRPFVIRWVWSYGGGHFLVAHGLVGDTMSYLHPWPGEGLKTGSYSWVVSGGNHTWAHTLTLTTTCACTATSTCCDGCKAKNNGGSCSDGDACTTTDACQGGSCQGSSPVVCKAKDTCHLVGTCNTKTGVCSNPVAKDGSSCDDSDLCTKTDSCKAGVCTGSSPVVCKAKDTCHLVGTCDVKTGTCSDPPVKDGTTCDDKDPCTLSDACQSGLCAGVAKTCTAKDTCHLAGTCDAKTGTCSDPLKADGALCDDGDGCTLTDSCAAGSCVGSNPVTCVAADQCHLAGTCDAKTGTCDDPTQPDGLTCDDQNACTQNDACLAGVCSGSAITCPAPDECQHDGVCSAGSGACSYPPVPDGTPCSAGHCIAGVCAARPEAGPEAGPEDAGPEAGDDLGGDTEVVEPAPGCCRVGPSAKSEGPGALTLGLTLLVLVLLMRRRQPR
jgi:hypothetical protein